MGGGKFICIYEKKAVPLQKVLLQGKKELF